MVGDNEILYAILGQCMENVGKKGTVQMNRVFLKSLEGEIENSRKRETAVLHFTLSLWFSCVYFVSNYNIQYDNN